ncbi:MAG: glycoside hydrolase family 5 protein [Treponema sp.]|jgi:aryl-phospho-beta-D-glucosidase BglC (GH1 family)|nr:glycoside hydrolase family 5 protein [Treponema sp.]
MDFLHVKGDKVVDQKGGEIRLRGASVGGWMNMENFIDGYPGVEAGLRRTMTETLGEEMGGYFFETLLDNFFAEEDVALVKKYGANTLRLALNYRHFEDDDKPFVYKEAGFARLEQALSWCEKHGVYVILDMHAVQGWQNAHWHSDNTNATSLFWTHRLFQDRLKKLWQEIACRYQGRAVIAGYELMNEPVVNMPVGDLPYVFGDRYSPRWDLMNRVYGELVSAIREIDKKHIIFMEGDRYGQLFDGLEAPFTDNLVYSSHNYTVAGFGPGVYPGNYKKNRTDETSVQSDWWDKKTQGELFGATPGAVFARKHGVPLWVGEFGSQYNTGKEDLPYRVAAMDDQLTVFNEWGAHWTTWTYKDMGVMGWVTLNPESDYARLVAPIQKKKTELGAENFVGWNSVSVGKQKNRELAETIAGIAEIPGIESSAYATGLSIFTLTGYAAACLQPAYCSLFKGMTKGDLDQVLSSFALKNCVINEPFRAVLEKRLV